MNLINYFCCNLYCVVLLLLLCYVQYLILETSIGICIVSFVLFMCYVFFFGQVSCPTVV